MSNKFFYRLRYNKTGCKRYLSQKDIKQIQDEIMASGGDGFDFNKANNIVQRFTDKQLSARNKLTSAKGSNKVSNHTVNVYMEEIAQNPFIGICANVKKRHSFVLHLKTHYVL